MFSKLFSLSLLVVGVYCQNASLPNFFVDDYAGAYYPYPTDTGNCIQNGIFDDVYNTFECVNGSEWMIRRTVRYHLIIIND